MNSQSHLIIGWPAPDFSLLDISGASHSLADFRSKVVILNFWSAECTWSERTDKELLALLQEWGGQVVLLTIASNVHEDKELVRKTAGQRRLPKVLLDEQVHLANLYDAQTTPHLFVIDPHGILRYQGAFDDITFRQRTASKDYLRLAVEAILAGEDPDPAETPAYGCAIDRPV